MCHQFQIPSLTEIKKYLITDLKLPLIEPDSNLPQNSNIFPPKKAPDFNCWYLPKRLFFNGYYHG